MKSIESLKVYESRARIAPFIIGIFLGCVIVNQSGDLDFSIKPVRN
jgi:hypothetical protein